MAIVFAYSIVKILPLMLLMIQPSFGAVAVSPQALPDDICREAVDIPDRDFCLDFFQQHSGSGKPIEILAEITIQETLKNATNVVVFVSRMKNLVAPDIANLLEICKEGYNAIVNQYVDASFAFAKRDFRTVQVDEGKCPRIVEDCRKNVDGPVPILRPVNHQMDLLVSISIATSNRLGTGRRL